MVEAIEEMIAEYAESGTLIDGTDLYWIRMRVPGCPRLRVTYHIDSDTQCTCLAMEMAEGPAPGPLDDFVT